MRFLPLRRIDVSSGTETEVNEDYFRAVLRCGYFCVASESMPSEGQEVVPGPLVFVLSLTADS